MKVLIVEDEIRIREGIRKLLNKTEENFEAVEEAGDGEEGLMLCEKFCPDLIITDIQMPKMDGLKMLKAINDRGQMPKAIVLSAYSEFEYARGAMKLGVTEYLLKPINLNDFTQALKSIKQQMKEDRRKKPTQIGTLEQVLREIMGGRMEISGEVREYLRKNYGINASDKVILLVTYLGISEPDELKSCKKRLDHSLSLYKGIGYCSLEEKFRQSVITVIYRYPDRHDLERWIQYQLLQQTMAENSVTGLIETESLSSMQEGIQQLFPYMDWNISFEESVLISYPRVTSVQTGLCVYPKELETKLKAAVCSTDRDRITDLLTGFTDCFRDGHIYDPREIKECYVRFIWSVLEMAKDVGNESAGNIRQQRLLEQIMSAKTQKELDDIMERIRQVLLVSDNDSNTNNLIVKRAKSMIHEFYNSGITLDEIAARLNITPEYLGTQFHKETGQTFSAYIKNYRISKARELLVGTGLKLYEIAERVGYSDPKYFSKVFRDVTGQLPADYRKTKK